MILNIRYQLKEYIRKNSVLIFFIGLSFLIGAITGISSACLIPKGQSGELVDFVQRYCSNNSAQMPDRFAVFMQSFANNTRMLFVLWICGLCFYFIPLSFCVLGIKGFGIGFTCSFLAKNFGGKGVALAAASIMPQGVFVLPMLAFAAISTVHFASGRSYKESSMIKDYTFKYLMYAAILVIAALVDSFISPVFISSICNLF